LKTLLLSILFTLFIGCASKQTYLPQNLQSVLPYHGYLPADIIDSSLDGATLKNGSILTQNGINTAIKVEENEHFLSQYKEYTFASGVNVLHIYQSNGDKRSITLDATPLSIKSHAGILALLLNDNSLLLLDYDGTLLFRSKQKEVVAYTSNIATPIFFDDLVIFPTLDGKIVIVNFESKEEKKSFVVSNKSHFNNITFLAHSEGIIYAGNRHNLRAITPKANYKYEATFNLIKMVDNHLIAVTNSGIIALLNKELQSITEIKYPFASIVAIAANDKNLFFLEKQGFLIQTDKNLALSKVYPINDNIEENIFVSKTNIYYKSRFISLPH
jgi:hypothetical protein